MGNGSLAVSSSETPGLNAPWRPFLQLFIVSMPFLHALGIGAWLPLPMVIAALALVAALATGAVRWIWFESWDALLVIMLFCGCLPLATLMDFSGQKNINHFFALVVTVVLFYIWMRAWISHSEITLEQIGVGATIALAVASAAVVLEFALVNTTGLYLADLIPYTADEMPQARVLENLMRPRGLSAEPGFSAMVFEALIPLSITTMLRHRWLLFTVAPLAVAGFLMLFSAGAIGSMVLAAALLIGFGRGLGLKVLLAVAGVALVAIYFAGTEMMTWLFDQVVGRKVVDLFEGGDASGIQDIAGRYVAYRVAAESTIAYPFGIGWGMISQIFASGVQVPDVPQIQSRGLLSLYLEILVAAGVPGLLCFLAFVTRMIVRLARCADPARLPVLFGLITLAIHHMFVLEFWFPMFWFYLALAAVWIRRDREAASLPLRA